MYFNMVQKKRHVNFTFLSFCDFYYLPALSTRKKLKMMVNFSIS